MRRVPSPRRGARPTPAARRDRAGGAAEGAGGAARDIELRDRAGETVALVGETGRRQVDDDQAAGPLLRPGRPARSPSTATTSATSTSQRASATQLGYVPAGGVPVHRDDPRQHRLRPSSRRPTPRSRRRRATSAPTTSSPLCPAATGTRWRSGDARSRPASASCSPWPGPSWSTPRSSSSTRRPRTSTLANEARVAAAMQRLSQRAAPRSSSPTACRRPAPPTASSSSTPASIAEVGSHDELVAAEGRYASMWEAFETAGSGRPAAAERG